MELPESIGGYAVERELGAGGMGTVYLARSRGGRSVAVKVARPELAGDAHFRERFRAEVEAARRVGGFHTAQVVDADPDAAAPWLATAYIAGPTLGGLLEAEGAMDEDRLRRLGAALAEALAAIHGCGLVHRDLKPGNIIMAADGPRVLDFGIARAMESARLTTTGVAFGTPGFLAPEQALGTAVTGAADVFALGAVLVAAAGGSAFGAGTPMGLMYRSVHEAPDLTAVPEGVRDVVGRCLAKDATERPTPGELLDLIAPASPVPPHPPTLQVPADAPPPLPPMPPTPPQGSYGPPPHAAYGGPNPYATPVPNMPPPVGPNGQPPFVPNGPPPAAPNGQPPVGPYGHPLADSKPAGEGDISFMAADSTGGVVIDATGVTIQAAYAWMSHQEPHTFGWEEIAAVQYAAEQGTRLRVTVITRAGAVHHAQIRARRSSRLRTWLEDLPLVIEAYR
ncbi:Serine/threonine-protein kinase PknD [Streptomyces sp. RB5]|uniref:Serine/threonine-protein kinase PknD n=1 Tax=Streptomyces smaragdinus TaxID=2585196 RepID=A0A7K0CRS8_9ACTN|nr:serine/threonine-protein kinase [Streptomyces smaragdinus]MQY16151.1 Serine/threonine-protein kinase PknD [Streptomyces smaragdinus]